MPYTLQYDGATVPEAVVVNALDTIERVHEGVVRSLCGWITCDTRAWLLELREEAALGRYGPPRYYWLRSDA